MSVPVFTSDSITCDSVTRERTEEGYLRVTVRAGRSGIMSYSCKKMGFKDPDGTGVVNVLRHPDDAFDESSLNTILGKDITFTHPESGEVTQDNYSKLSKGVVISPGYRTPNEKSLDDDIFVTGLIKDKTTIDALERQGFNGASLGYKAFYVYEPGEWNGVRYHYRQFNIRYNHLAIVLKGRAGKDYTVLDEEDLFMDEKEKAAFKTEIMEGVKEVVSSLMPAAPEPAESITADAIDEAVQKRSSIIDKAKTIKPDIDCNGKSDVQIMREILGEKVTNDHSEEIVEYAFNSLPVGAPKAERTHKSLNLGTKGHDDKTTVDAADTIAQSKRDFRKNTARGFESLRKELTK